MLTFEIAKQLKDAGFPQSILEGKGGWWPEHKKDCKRLGDKAEMCPDEGCDCPEDQSVYNPTLSELIEACKGNTFHLIVASNGYCTLLDHEGQMIHQCQTPLEAVAKLYLKLNT